MGRAPLDEEAIRQLEKSNPGVEFDWTEILKGQQSAPERPVQQERRARPRPREFPTSVAFRPPEPPAAAQPPDRPRERQAPPIAAVPVAAELPADFAPVEDPAPADFPPDSVPADRAADAPTAAAARLGAEGLARLRARHAEVLTRIAEKTTDPVRREELKTSAERLNPDTWVTDGEVTAGLEAYESVFETLRGVIGRRRKRRRKRSAGPDQPGGAAERLDAQGAPEAEDEEANTADEPEGDL